MPVTSSLPDGSRPFASSYFASSGARLSIRGAAKCATCTLTEDLAYIMASRVPLKLDGEFEQAASPPPTTKQTRRAGTP
eukprot:4843081-Pyramimonas_sp.AAC.1